MRAERMDRFSILPFSIGYASQSSVDIISQTPKKCETESKPSEEFDDQKLILKSSNISDKLIQKMVKSFKSLPQVFDQLMHREEEEEEEVVEMEIGLPIDVQHVAHVGWDGSNNISSTVTNINMKEEKKKSSSWGRAPELLSFTSLFQPAI